MVVEAEEDEGMPAGHTTRPWLGSLTSGDHWATWRGKVGDSQVHRHLAAQAVFGEHPACVYDGAGRLWEGTCILIDPLVPHRLVASDMTELVFAEPRGEGLPTELAGRLLCAGQREAPIVLTSPDPQLRFWPETPASEGAGVSKNPSRARLESSLHQIDLLLERGPVQLADVADRVGLSSERFRHLFAEALNVPFRRYVLWRRIGRAINLMNKGNGVTVAAHAAGFADGAHFARTMQVMFGIAPSALKGFPVPPR